jgi:hypothetical protein
MVIEGDNAADWAAQTIAQEVQRESSRLSCDYGIYHGYFAATYLEAAMADREGRRLHI